ncbi:hypothetical protein GCM10017784_37770 [Deinococcus indicus]|nr:hypothetical protein GCM10017784_37770 [Deinococcus indicus]
MIRLTVHGGLKAESDQAQTRDRLTGPQAGTDALNAGAPTGHAGLLTFSVRTCDEHAANLDLGAEALRIDLRSEARSRSARSVRADW